MAFMYNNNNTNNNDNNKMINYIPFKTQDA